jgi:hypothetical protein
VGAGAGTGLAACEAEYAAEAQKKHAAKAPAAAAAVKAPAAVKAAVKVKAPAAVEAKAPTVVKANAPATAKTPAPAASANVQQQRVQAKVKLGSAPLSLQQLHGAKGRGNVYICNVYCRLCIRCVCADRRQRPHAVRERSGLTGSERAGEATASRRQECKVALFLVYIGSPARSGRPEALLCAVILVISSRPPRNTQRELGGRFICV